MAEENQQAALMDFMWLYDNLGKNSELIETLLIMFEEMLGNQSDILQKAFDPLDMIPLQKRLHALKGTAATVGAVGVRQGAVDLEDACKENRTDDVISQLPDFLALCGKTQETIREFLRNGMPFPE